MRTDDDRRLRPDQRRSVQAFAGLGLGLAPDRVRKPTPEPRACDLPAPGGVEADFGLAHGGGDGLLAGLHLCGHRGDEVLPDVELELDPGRVSRVQTSRSRSRTDSPCTMQVAPSITIPSPGHGATTSLTH